MLRHSSKEFAFIIFNTSAPVRVLMEIKIPLRQFYWNTLIKVGAGLWQPTKDAEAPAA